MQPNTWSSWAGCMCLLECLLSHTGVHTKADRISRWYSSNDPATLTSFPEWQPRRHRRVILGLSGMSDERQPPGRSLLWINEIYITSAARGGSVWECPGQIEMHACAVFCLCRTVGSSLPLCLFISHRCAKSTSFIPLFKAVASPPLQLWEQLF